MAIDDSPINRFAAGLLGLVDIKAMGKNPSRLSQVVSPVLDLEPYYRAETRQVNFYIVNPVVATGFFFPSVSGAIVPTGKVWLVENIRMAVQVGAGNSISVTPAVARLNGANQDAFWSGNASTVTGAFAGIHLSYYFEKPLVCLPGMRLAISVNAFSGAGTIASLTSTYSELDY